MSNKYRVLYKAPNVEVHRRVAEHIGKYDTLLEIVKRKLRWFGHVTRAKATLGNTILWGRVEGKDHEEGKTMVGRCKGNGQG